MRQYIVDAFTDQIFKGNPAAVCVLDQWPGNALMQNIAKENSLSETAFAVKEGNAYRLRWFTPKAEIDFCGHATLAAAYVITSFIEPVRGTIEFLTMSGKLTVDAAGELFRMNFPTYQLRSVPVTEQMTAAIGARPLEAYLDRDLLLVLDTEEAVTGLRPDQEALRALDGLCVAVTARGREHDCVSRVFAPELDMPEDPVTGSTHCMIFPYWAKRLNKTALTALQASERSGVLYGELQGDRVVISGKAVLFAVSEILPQSGIQVRPEWHK